MENAYLFITDVKDGRFFFLNFLFNSLVNCTLINFSEGFIPQKREISNYTRGNIMLYAPKVRKTRCRLWTLMLRNVYSQRRYLQIYFFYALATKPPLQQRNCKCVSVFDSTQVLSHTQHTGVVSVGVLFICIVGESHFICCSSNCNCIGFILWQTESIPNWSVDIERQRERSRERENSFYGFIL